MATITTRSGKGSPLTNNEVDANFNNLNTDKAELSGAAFTGAITTNSTIDGRDVATDGTKLDGIESGATADQTAAQIKTAYESNSDTNAFTDADESKLDGIEASADVTDTTNVTAAGALMDSELTSIASVKALNQGVATTDSPTFVDVTATSLDISGDIDVDGTTNLDATNIVGALDVTGTATMDGLSASASTTDYIASITNSNGSDAGKGLFVSTRWNTATNSVAKFVSNSGSNAVANFAGNGDISFYEDTGTTAKLFWDASAESLGIGTSSPTSELTIGADTPQIDLFKTSSADVLANIRAETDAGSGGKLVFQTKQNGNTALDRMAIDDDGNVGIGTSSPSRQLEVQSSTGGNAYLSVKRNNATSTELVIGAENGNTAISSEGAIPMAFYTGGSEAMRIDASGNVGIGRTDPTQLLEVHKAAGGDQTVAKFSAHNYNDTGKTYIELGTEYGDGSSRIGSFNDTGNKSVLVFETHGASSGAFDERVRIDSSGNVGIGVVPEAWTYFNPIQAGRSSFAGSTGQTGVGYNWYFDGAYKYIASDYALAYQQNATSGVHSWSTAASGTAGATATLTERARIDSSGNLLVGTTSNSSSVAGVTAGNSGLITACRSSNYSGIFNRLTNDGDIVQFRKGGSTVGSIGSEGGDALYIQSGTTSGAGLLFHPTQGNINPARNNAKIDNAIDLGRSTHRFKDIYATNGTIQTSDAREKTEVREFTDSEMRVAKKLSKNIGFFQWLASVVEKGDDARLHCGQTVQSVIAEFEAEGLDAFDYAMICYNEWDADTVEHPAVEAVEAVDAVYDEEGELISEAIEAVEAADAWTETTQEAGDRYSLRTDQLNHFMVKGLAQAQEELEARISALEA